MTLPLVSATLLCVSLFAFPVFGQWTARPNQRAGTTSPQDNQIAMATHAYDTLLARGNQRGAAVAAGQLALKYEQRSDFTNAATWWQTSYKMGYEQGLPSFMNLVISNKITLQDPDKVRPYVEVRAFCGSQMARAYLLNHFQETTAQLPDYTGQTANACIPAAPDDHMDQSLLIAARRRHDNQMRADYYRLHPEESPEYKEKQAIAGAALLLGALVIHAASLPQSGPGSIACNKFRNGYPGFTDSSVCDTPSR